MIKWNTIPEPVSFNPLKHHAGFIKKFSDKYSVVSEERILKEIIPELKHIGNSVADIYTGKLSPKDICREILTIMKKEGLSDEKHFIDWIGFPVKEYRKFSLSDKSQWVAKYLANNKRYFHIFPGRNDCHTIRSRGNSLKTAILFDILFDKGDIILRDLNSVRKMLALSPIVKIEAASGIINDIRLIQNLKPLQI